MSGKTLSLVYDVNEQNWITKGKNYKYGCIHIEKLFFPKDFPFDKVMIKIVPKKLKDIKKLKKLDKDRLILQLPSKVKGGNSKWNIMIYIF